MDERTSSSESKPERPPVLVPSTKVRDAQFTANRLLTKPWRLGYDEIEVDTLLDEVVATLAYYEDKVWASKS